LGSEGLYEVFFRPEVEVDLREFGKKDRLRLLETIRARLSTHPLEYGKPLGGSLQALRRIRSGDYRIAYQVQRGRVVVWAVKHRKDIYAELERRFGGR
jgi:mRNA-degrading endonuclease RelE of RelBE toxin-antitoxin system